MNISITINDADIQAKLKRLAEKTEAAANHPILVNIKECAPSIQVAPYLRRPPRHRGYLAVGRKKTEDAQPRKLPILGGRDHDNGDSLEYTGYSPLRHMRDNREKTVAVKGFPRIRPSGMLIRRRQENEEKVERGKLRMIRRIEWLVQAADGEKV